MGHTLTQKYELGALTASDDTPAIDIQNMSKISFQITQSAGSVDWDLTIQESNDGENWISSSDTVNVTAAGSVIVDRIDTCVRYCRLFLEKTTGDLADVVVVFNGKF